MAHESPTVLNLIFLGTGYHRLNKGKQHLLTELENSIISTPNQYVHLIDGLGGVPDSDNASKAKYPMLGTYDFTSSYDAENNELITNKTPRSAALASSVFAGKVQGIGFHDAMAEATALVDTLVAAGKKPLVINMYGFSRGADTALRFCNTLNGKYADVKANIFAIDAVAGVGRRSAKKGRLIPEMVEEYHAVLMANENNFGFEPQDKSRLNVQNTDTTKVTFQILGGRHSSGLTFKDDPTIIPAADNKVKKTTDSARLVWDGMHKFAKRHGTVMRDVGYLAKIKEGGTKYKIYPYAPMNDIQRFEAYTRMVAHKNKYAALSPQNSLLNYRSFIKSKEDYFLHGVNYFQDAEHVRLFQAHHSKFFDYFFQKNTEHASLRSVLEEIQDMKKHPDLVTSLVNAGLPDISKIISLEQIGQPQGISLTLTDLRTSLSRLWEKVLSIVLPVFTGQDDSVSVKTAAALREQVHQVLLSDRPATSKALEINAVIKTELLKANNNNQPFYLKLASMMGDTSKTTSYADRIKQMVQPKQTYSFFKRTTPMSGPNKMIVAEIIKFLEYLGGIGMANDKESIDGLLKRAMAQTRSYIDENKGADQSLDKILRISLVETTSYTVLPKTDEEKVAINQLLDVFEDSLKQIPNTSSNTPESPRTL
jgi:hypothetical protein